MSIHCSNGVTITIDKMGTLNGVGRVWYNIKGIANIMYLSEISKNHRMDHYGQHSINNALYVRLNAPIRMHKVGNLLLQPKREEQVHF